MNKTKKLFIIVLSLVLALTVALFVACKPETDDPGQKDPDPTPTVGKISGIVTDDDGEPVDATVILGDNEVDTDDDGKYEIRNVTIADGITLTVNATGYNEATKTINKSDFTDGAAVVNIQLAEATANISGRVVVQGTTTPLQGASVTVSGKTAVTNANGEFSFTDVSIPRAVTVRAHLEGYEDGSAQANPRNIKNGAISGLRIELVAPDLEELPGLKEHQLYSITLDKLTYSRSDLKNDAWGYSSNNGGKIDNHSEGICINSDTRDVRDNLSAYLYGKLNVTEQNKIITVYARMFKGQNAENADGSNAAYAKLNLHAFVIKSDNTFEYITIGGPETIDTETYKAVSFDMSAHVGKTLVLVLGTNSGYHCCLDRIEFAQVAPAYINMSGVEGVGSILAVGKTNATSFDAAALKSNVWGKGGPTTQPEAGVQLNSGDPWKAVEFDSANPQPVNSYMYVLTDVAANTKVKVHSTIINLEEVKDPGQGGKVFLPYIGLAVFDKNGVNLYQSEWNKVEVSENNEDKIFEFDISEYAGEDRIVMIVCNVGYRPTITAVEFTAQSAVNPPIGGGDNGDEQNPAVPPQSGNESENGGTQQPSNPSTGDESVNGNGQGESSANVPVE